MLASNPRVSQLTASTIEVVAGTASRESNLNSLFLERGLASLATGTETGPQAGNYPVGGGGGGGGCSSTDVGCTSCVQ